MTVCLCVALSSSGGTIQKPVINQRAAVDESSVINQRAGDNETSTVDRRPVLDHWRMVEVGRENDADRNTSAVEVLGHMEVVLWLLLELITVGN